MSIRICRRFLLVWLAIGSVAAQAEDPFSDATRHIMAGDYEAAIEVYDTYVENAPQGEHAALAAFGAGSLQQLALEDPEAAVRSFDRVLTGYRQSPWAPEAARRKAECLQAVENWGEAGSAYQAALELAVAQSEGPGADWINEVSLAAADCFYELGDRERVVETYERALDQSLPPNAAATTHYRVGNCYETAGDAPNAARHYARILTDYPFTREFGEAAGKRGLIEPHQEINWDACEAFSTSTDLRQRAALEESIERCRAVMDMDASRALKKAAEFRIVVDETILSGNFSEGSRRLRSLTRDLPPSVRVEQVTQRLQLFDQVAGMEAEVERNPDSGPAHATLGELYVRMGSLDKGIETLTRALEITPYNISSRLNLCFALIRRGRVAEAREIADRHLAEHPEATNVMNMMGYQLLQQQHIEEALNYFRRYVEAAPEEANAHDSYGEGLMTAGRLEEARGEYQRAVALDPTFSNAYYMLGSIQQQLGEETEAREAYARFLELTPGDPRAPQARAAIEELGGISNR